MHACMYAKGLYIHAHTDAIKVAHACIHASTTACTYITLAVCTATIALTATGGIELTVA